MKVTTKFNFTVNLQQTVESDRRKVKYTLEIEIQLPKNNPDTKLIHNHVIIKRFKEHFKSVFYGHDRNVFTVVWILLSRNVLNIYPALITGFTLTCLDSGAQYSYKEAGE